MQRMGGARLFAIAGVALAACDGAIDMSLSGDLGGDGVPFEYLASYPHDAETVWSDEAQGIAHDDVSWFISNKWSIFRYSLGADLEVGAFVNSASLPLGCSHFGDIGHDAGRLFAPLEGCDRGAPNRVYMYDATSLRVTRWGVVPDTAQGHVAWVAVAPGGARIVTSDSDADLLNVFAADFQDGQTLALLEQIPLGRRVHGVQGGQFGPSGELYLVSNDAEHPSNAGILVLALGEHAATVAGFIPASGIGSDGREMEGITYWDVDGLTAKPGLIRGQLHWILLENDWYSSDDATLEHVALGPRR